MFNKNKIEFIVEGMHCEHCAKKVKEALLNLEEIKKVKVILENKIVIIEIKDKDINMDKIENIINNLGYSYKKIEK